MVKIAVSLSVLDNQVRRWNFKEVVNEILILYRINTFITVCRFLYRPVFMVG